MTQTMAPLTLPYVFDTRKQAMRNSQSLTLIFVGTVLLFAKSPFSEPLSLFLCLAVIGVLTLGWGFWLFRQSRGACGTVRYDRVVFQPDYILGFRRYAPAETIPVSNFTMLEICLIGKGHYEARLTLIGKGSSSPKRVILAIDSLDVVKQIGQFLATELNVKIVEQKL